MDQKKQRERAILTEFRVAYSGFPAGELIDGESPDFTLATAEGVIGFEVRDFLRGESPTGGSRLRQREVFCKEVTERAQLAYEAICRVTVVATLHWLVGPARRASPHELATTIAQLIAHRVAISVDDHERIDFLDFGSTPLDGQLHLISLDYPRVYATNSFVPVAADFVTVGSDEIQQAIDTKNEKAQAYRRRADRLWLIMWAGSGYLSANAELLEEARNHTYTSVFDQVFFFDRLASRAIPLKVLPLQVEIGAASEILIRSIDLTHEVVH